MRLGFLCGGLLSLLPLQADASRLSDVAAPLPAAPHRTMLAQARAVDVFFDEQGRRIILDRYTGQVIAIEEPRRVLPERRLRDGGVVMARPRVNDPEALERYRRFREYQLGQREPPTTRELLDAYPLDREDPWAGEPDARDTFPDAPGEMVAREEPVERRPLDDNPVTGSTPVPVEPLAPQAPAPVAPLEPKAGASEETARLQILLDRAGISPGVIDGRMGGNVQKALDGVYEMTGHRLDPKDAAAIERMLEDTGGPAFTTYTITPEDAAGPYVASVPADYGEKAQLERLAFTSVPEMLAERFHMDEAYLKAINPGADFNRPGTQIKVANPGVPKTGAVARIVADKPRTQVRAYDADGNLVAAYPATIGSNDTPSPSGVVQVDRIAFDPEYTYNPKLNFKQGNNDRVLRIPPGPNGPVGSIWIALSKPTYGIHGTPDPSKIGKTNSHGCVRLTNWDAHELAKMVKPGVTVEFVE